MTKLNFSSTKEIHVSNQLIDQVIGQDEAVQIIRKAAKQRRHVLLIGEPGTGKSLIGLALSQLLPREKLVDVLAFPNPNDENQPLIRTVPAGKGRELVSKARAQSFQVFRGPNAIIIAIAILLSLLLLAEGSLLSVLIDFHFVRCLVPVNISSFGTRSGLQAFPSLNVLTSLIGEILLAGGRVLCGIVGVIPLRHG